MERKRYDLIRLAFARKKIMLFRVQDGGFNSRTGQFISAQKGTDFYGFNIETGVFCVVEAKEDSSTVLTESLLKKVRPSQHTRMNLVTQFEAPQAFLTTYSPEDKTVRCWDWRNREIGTAPLWAFQIGGKKV